MADADDPGRGAGKGAQGLGGGRKLRSRDWFDNRERMDMTALYLERFMNNGVTPEELRAGKPIQCDLPADRADRVEATGHADLVELDDGSWWGVFLATRPFAGQSTLLGRETWLLPVEWRGGWPLFLDPGEAVPMEAARPALPPWAETDWSRWTDQFDEALLSPEWLRMRSPEDEPWFALDPVRGELRLTAREETAGGLS